MKTFNDSRLSKEDYFEWRKQRSLSAIEKIENFKKMKGLKILDVGCGYGSLMSNLLEKGAYVVGVDVDKDSFKFATKFMKGKKNAKVILVKDEKLPFKKNSFDIVFLFDVIEHVNKPAVSIDECCRVLKPGGFVYVEFTPYYSLVGHHLYDYAKWPIHILPEKYIKKIVYGKKIQSSSTVDQDWSMFKALNKLRISEFQRLIRKFSPIEERFVIKYPELFEINIPLLRFFGPFKDFLTLSFQGIYKKAS